MYIWQGMWLDSSKPPFDDIRVRQAVYMAVDKATIAEHGPSSPGRASGPMFSGGYWAIPREELEAHPFYQPDMEARREEARRLLAEAGYPDGFTFSLGHNDGRDGEQFFLMVESDLRQIGLRADGLPGDTTEMGSRRITDALMHGGGIVDDPDNILGWFFKSDGVRNWYGHVTPGFDEKFIEQSRDTDQERRLQLVRELELLAINDAAVQFYYYSGRWTARHQSVRFLVDHDTLSPSNTDTNFNLATVWIDQAKR
jgi:peptide/nickel transport system substrate-binding protein